MLMIKRSSEMICRWASNKRNCFRMLCSVKGKY